MSKGLVTIEKHRALNHGEHVTIAGPDEWAPLFTSKWPDCLTHITRWCSIHAERTFGNGRVWDAYDYATAWCGVIMSARPVHLADATGFACHKCIARCEQLGLPTFSLVPDTGCSVSGGKRGQMLGRKFDHPYSQREIYR